MPSIAPKLAERPVATEPPFEDLHRLAAGDLDSLAAAYRRFSPSVHRLAVALTLSADDADDVVQEVFIGLPEAMRRYAERGAFEGWLLRITARVALRKAKLDQRNSGDGGLLFATAPPTALIDRMTLETALRTLPTETRVIVVLKLIGGYSHDEIARHLGLRRNTVEVRFSRALAKLRAFLSPGTQGQLP